MWQKILARLRGLPRTPQELDRSLALLGMLRTQGWHATARHGRPVNGSGMPVPWWTQGVSAWLAPRLRSTDRVFEWGAGHSTLWFALRVHSVVAVEDNPYFARSLQQRASRNADVLLRTGEAYVSAITAYPPQHFKVIVIDGVARPACAALAPDYLSPDGLLVYDNSDRPEALPALQQLAEAGFLRVDWYGLVSGSHHGSVTSLLCRDPARWFTGPPPAWCGY